MWKKEIPYNDLPLLPWDFDYNQTKFLKLAIKWTEELWKLNWLIHLLPNAKILISPLLIKESVESSAIENIHTTTEKVLQSKALWEEKVSWPEKEVLHYQEAILYGFEEVKKLWWISTNLIIKLQSIIEPSKPWIRKIHWTVIANWSEIVYTPPEWEQNILNLLSNLEKFINNFEDDIEPLVKLPVIHYQFESIHPFYDGNGRTGRILNILYLILAKKLDFPVLFLSEYINKTRNTYYKLLNQTTKTWDYTNFIVYMLEGIIQQAKKTNKTILNINQLMENISQKLNNLWLDSYSISHLLFSEPFLSIKSFSEKLWISRQAWSKYIKKMEKSNIINTIQIWRTKLVYIPEFIKLLS